MSARLVEAARAFATIAEHLSQTRRDEIAEKIAGLIDSSIAPPAKTGSQASPKVLPDPVHPEFDATAKFLLDHGYSSGDLVRAAGRLEEFLKQHRNLTREAGMRVWLLSERGEER